MLPAQCVGRRHARQLNADGSIDIWLSGILLHNRQAFPEIQDTDKHEMCYHFCTE